MENLTKQQTIEHLGDFIRYLKQDLESHLHVMRAVETKEAREREEKYTETSIPQRKGTIELSGGQCIGMALTAFAALDYLGYLIVGGHFDSIPDTANDLSKPLDKSKGHATSSASNYQGILQSKHFKNKFRISRDELFVVLRSAMVHQLFPRGSVGMWAKENASELVFNDSNGNRILDTYYLLKTTIEGFESFLNHLRRIDDRGILKYSNRLKAMMENDKKTLEDLKKSKLKDTSGNVPKNI